MRYMVKSKNPLVSVIVPVYNVEKYIDTCLSSIINQTYKNLEIIVVNDGSPGNIVEIASSLQKKHKNILFVNLDENVGLFRARIAGIQKATGEYIIHIDGDDTVGIEYVEKLVDRAVETHADIVLGEMVEYHEKGKHKQIRNLAKSIEYDEVISADGLALSELLRKNNFIWEVCGKLYSRAVVDAAMKDLQKIDRHLIMGEDMLFNFHFFYYCRKLARAEFAFYYYLINDGSITAKSADISKKERVLRDLNFVFSTIEQFMLDKGILEKFERQYRYLRNMQAAKYYYDIQESFSGKDRRVLNGLVEEMYYDRDGFEHEVALRSADVIGDIKDLRWRLESMNSIKVSGLKFLSNIKRKVKSYVK